ncbi:hypothetical protein HAX54_015102 [Datura stramonium]|uniref:Uncharacterized protein n=1 Tax=Datura stramonium TaxID=4076 RepID=A0ABS8TS17_DATST|nr:hypothetical protein [Datura stramonium]
MCLDMKDSSHGNIGYKLQLINVLLSQDGGGGIVRDPLVHQEVIEKIIDGVQNHGFQCKGWIESPLKGVEGNKEFLASFNRAVISEEVEKQ